LQHEIILKERQEKQTSTKLSETDIKEQQKLEKFITDLRTKQVKIENILPQLEQQIQDLTKNQIANSDNNSSLIEATAQIRSSLRQLNTELGLPDEPLPIIANNSTANNFPNAENSLLQDFKLLRLQSQELILLLEKIILNYEKNVNDFKTANAEAKKAARESGIEFDMEQGKIGEMAKQIESYLNIAKRNKPILEGYASEKDYQTFLSASSETQKANLDLIQDALNHAIKSLKEHFQSFINDNSEWIIELSEGAIKALEDLITSEPKFRENLQADFLKEKSKLSEEKMKQDLEKAKRDLQYLKDTFASIKDKLDEFDNQNSATQINFLQEIWQSLKELEARNQAS